MSEVYNFLRDGGMILRIKPTVTNCNTLKVFPTFDIGLKHLLTVVNGTGSGSYTGNELIQIIANSVNNYYFDHWNDPQSVVTDINSGTTTVTMPFLDCTVTAVILPYRTLTVNNGSGSSNILKPGDVRQIVANSPATNYVFDNWSGDTAYLSANTETADITMPDANIALTANYKLQFTEINYGLLYNWYAISDSRNIAPVGWHVPTSTEWNVLINHLGGQTVAAGHMKQTGLNHWLSQSTGCDNSSGLSLIGSGYRKPESALENQFEGLNISFLYACYNQYDENSVWYVSGNHESDAIFMSAYLDKFWLTSIRLIKDDSVNDNYMTDNNGNIYPTIKIGTQVWTASNLITTRYRNNDVIPEAIYGSGWESLITGALSAYMDNWNNV